MRKIIRISLLLVLSFCLFSCGNNKPRHTRNDIKISSLSPQQNQQYRWGDIVTLQFEVLSEKSLPDTILVVLPDGSIKYLNADAKSVKWKTDKYGVGASSFTIQVIEDGKILAKSYVTIEVLSDVKAKKLGYKLINKYPHQRDAYTQGLVYDNGVFYEGTGLNGESKLRKVDVKTGGVLQEISLSDKFFGEGICLWKDKIIQLTWQSRVGFIYNKKNFILEKQLFYPTEGWGLTHNGEQLIMSDGSEYLYFLNPEDFNVERKIAVYDEHGKVKNLNELEYVNGKIYANIYDIYFAHFLMIVIDPQTGKVEEKCYFDDIIDLNKVDGKTDVFNGIAYDSLKNHFFVTGKWWPYVYEVELN